MHACGKCNVKLEFLDIAVGEGVILENRVKDFFTPYFIAYLCSISYFNSFMTSFLFAKVLTSTNRKIIVDPRKKSQCPACERSYFELFLAVHATKVKYACIGRPI